MWVRLWVVGRGVGVLCPFLLVIVFCPLLSLCFPLSVAWLLLGRCLVVVLSFGGCCLSWFAFVLCWSLSWFVLWRLWFVDAVLLVGGAVFLWSVVVWGCRLSLAFGGLLVVVVGCSVVMVEAVGFLGRLPVVVVVALSDWLVRCLSWLVVWLSEVVALGCGLVGGAAGGCAVGKKSLFC